MEPYELTDEQIFDYVKKEKLEEEDRNNRIYEEFGLGDIVKEDEEDDE